MSNQVCPSFNTMFSKFQWGFRKEFKVQHSLLLKTERWNEVLDNGGKTGAVLTDRSKVFDCINHNLLIANAYAVV